MIYTMGISGNSGSGKSLLTDYLAQLLGPKKVCILNGDNLHKWPRNHEQWKTYTHLDPKSNYLHKGITLLKTLQSNKVAYQKQYDHSSGVFTPKKAIYPKEYIIYEGLHTLYLKEQRKLYNLQIFLDTEESLRQHWKIIRDTTQRNKTLEQSMEQIQMRQEDALKYIQPQRQYADSILRIYPTSPIQNIGSTTENIALACIIHSNIYDGIESFCAEIEGIDNITIQVLSKENVTIQISHSITNKDTKKIAQKYIHPILPDIDIYAGLQIFLSSLLHRIHYHRKDARSN